MKLFTAINVVEKSNYSAVALRYKTKEVFVIEYYKEFSDIVIHYSRGSEEETFSLYEFVFEFPEFEKLEFMRMNKKGICALDKIWEYALVTINENLIELSILN
jgi:hypothetical protein